MKVNGVTKELDPGRGTVPIITNERTILPIRAIVETLGGNVEYEPVEKKITIKLDGKTLDIWIGKNNMKINNNNKTMDVAPVIINGRTMVLLRFVAENLGYEVQWEPTTKTVIIR